MRAHKKNQQGSLLISAVVLIVVIGFMGATITYMFGADTRASVDYYQSGEAFILAESGLEKGIREWSLVPTYPGEGPTALGGGSFTIITADTGTPGEKRITSTGTVAATAGNVSRTNEVVVQNSGGTSVLFSDPFPDIANWPGTGPTQLNMCGGGGGPQQFTQGSTVWSTENATGPTGGSILFQTQTGKNNRYAGYNEAVLPTPIVAGTTVMVDLWYRRDIDINIGPPNQFRLAFEAIASDGTVNRLWSDCTKTVLSWTQIPTVTWTVPAGQTIDRIRLAYYLRNRNNNSAWIRAYFDDVTITIGSGISILSWQELLP